MGACLGLQAAAAGDVGSAFEMQTTGGDVLQSRSLLLGTTGGRLADDRLGFEMGFSTREAIAPGSLFDAFSLSIARADGTGPALVATTDVFGLTLVPIAGGALSGGGVLAAEVAYSLEPLAGAGTTFAYRVEVSLPPSLVGQELRADFALFDNGDEVASRAYGQALPEPGTGWLFAAGALGLACLIQRRRRP